MKSGSSWDVKREHGLASERARHQKPEYIPLFGGLGGMETGRADKIKPLWAMANKISKNLWAIANKPGQLLAGALWAIANNCIPKTGRGLVGYSPQYI